MTALAVALDTSQVAVGLCDGSIVLLVGDILRGKGRQQTANVEGGLPVTGTICSSLSEKLRSYVNV